MKALEEQTGIPIIPVSAKESIKIHEVMEDLTKKLIERAEKKKYGLDQKNNNSHKITNTKLSNSNSDCC